MPQEIACLPHAEDGGACWHLGGRCKGPPALDVCLLIAEKNGDMLVVVGNSYQYGTYS